MKPVIPAINRAVQTINHPYNHPVKQTTALLFSVLELYIFVSQRLNRQTTE